MKKSILFLVCLSLLSLSSPLWAQSTAWYYVEYNCWEKGSGGRDQGPVNIGFNFTNSSEDCSFYYGDLYEMQNIQRDSFPASANTNQFFIRFPWGGSGNETFDYTNDIKNAYKTSSYWNKQYTLRQSQYFGWSSAPGDYFRVTVWPKNLTIQSVSGPELGTTLAQYDVTTIQATPGFPADAYTWKYQITSSGTWINLPNGYQGKANISFTGNDLLSNSFKSITLSGSAINVGLFAKDIAGNEKLYKIATFDSKFNAPKVISVNPQIADCFESQYTDVIIKFDKGFNTATSQNRKLGYTNYLQSLSSGSVYYIYANELNNNEYVLRNVPVKQALKFQLASLQFFEANGNSLADSFYVTPTSTFYNTNTMPLKLETTLSSTGVFCYDGHDGKVVAKVLGGRSPYTLTYKNKTTNITYATHTLSSANVTYWVNDVPIQDLSPADYKVTVTDLKGCLRSDSLTVVQPLSPFIISSSTATEVTGYGLSNGTLQVKLKGGTASLPQGYPLPKLTTGTITYNAQFVQATVNEFTFLFDQLPAGNYSFRGIDQALASNSSNIRDSLGCLAKQSFTIIQPPPLAVNFEAGQPIVCNGQASASFTAHVTGGKRYDAGKPYIYQWAYSVDGVNAYIPITGSDSLMLNRAAGFYQLTIKDKNNNTLIRVYEVTQPAAISYDVIVKNVTCLNWTDGALTVTDIQGGSAPYRISWPDGSSDLTWMNLGKGNYTVQVHDAFSCMIEKNVRIKDTLNEITLSRGTYRIPHCFGDADGSLGVQVLVASPPYTVLWNNGSTDTLLTGIKAGYYTVQVLNSKNCLKEGVFTLADPAAIPLELEATRYLCIDQVAEYNLTVPDSLYSYEWIGPQFNGTEGKVILSSPGRYVAKITDSKGCKRTDTLDLYRINETISSDFVIASQLMAGNEVLVTNITESRFQDTAYWEINHPDIEVKDLSFEYAVLVFKKPGVYKIGLRSHLGDCVKVLEKEVQVLQPAFDPQTYNGASSFIKNFEIRPNPNDGHFEVMVSLQDVASVKLRFLDFYSKSAIVEEEQHDAKEYLIPMHVTVAPGTYILFLETPYGTRITKVIIM